MNDQDEMSNDLPGNDAWWRHVDMGCYAAVIGFIGLLLWGAL